MMVPLLLFVAAIIIPTSVLGSSQEGGLLTITSDNKNLEFQQWQYREISTRSRWYIGCWSYDFLQGTGWYPSTWYQYISPVKINIDTIDADHNNDPSVPLFSQQTAVSYTVERTSRAKYCKAEPDEANFLDIKHINNETGTVLDGFLKIYPIDHTDHHSTTTTTVLHSISVRCAPAGVIQSPCLSCFLTCEEAHISWTGRENVQLNIVWEEP